jgi:ABC-type Zn uptake system ZnuABC Zn-binding protein ZnuA
MKKWLFWLVLPTVLLSACSSTPKTGGTLKVLAVESYIADLASNVAGDRLQIDTLIPLGVDPHSFELTPSDVAAIAEADVLIVNGTGFEDWLTETIQSSGTKAVIIEASAGLSPRNPTALEVESDEHDHAAGDPHFWLDPTLAVKYVENIRDGLSSADPSGKDAYAANASAYISQLTDLDAWIQKQVSTIPPDRRLLVTNHESFGYFADRYGFKIIGAIIPSITSGASPTPRELASLTDRIRQYNAPAIFLETGSSPQLAEQIASELQVTVVKDLYTHSLSVAGGDAPDYISMMRWDTNSIVEALK